MAQAEAAAARSPRAALDRIRAAGRPEEIDAQRARIQALQAAESSARREAERAEALLPSGAGGARRPSAPASLASRTAAERAEAEADAARLYAPPGGPGGRRGRARRGRGGAGPGARRCHAVPHPAPIAGTVLKVYARPGDQVGTDGLLDLADLEPARRRRRCLRDRPAAAAPGRAGRGGGPRRARATYAATLREIGWLVRRTTQAGTDPVAAVDARTVGSAPRPRRGGPRRARAADQHAGPGGDPAMNASTFPPMRRPGSTERPRRAHRFPALGARVAPVRRLPPPEPPPPKPRPPPGAALFLPLRLAWRQLRAEKARLASATAGVMFACVLVFMQLGFRAPRCSTARRRCWPDSAPTSS